MAFYVVTNNAEHLLHLGEMFQKDQFDIHDIIEVQACGHELDYVNEHLSGIPKSKKRVCNWFGDDAKFIASQFK